MTGYTKQTQNELIAQLNNQALAVLDFSAYENTQDVDVPPITLAGHTGFVLGVAVLPNNQVVSASQDCTLRVWDINSGACVKVLNGHTSLVYNVAVLPNNQVVSASHDKTLRVWDTDSGACVKVLKGHTFVVNGVAVLPNGQVVSGSWDKTLRVWDINSGTCVKVLNGHTSYVYGVAVLPNNQVVSASHDKTLRVWDTDSGACVKVLNGHTKSVLRVAVLPNNQVVSASDDKTLRVWDINRGDCIKVLSGHTGQVWGIAVLPNGQVVSASEDKTLRVWDINSGACVKVLKGHTRPVRDIVALPNGQVVSASDDKTLRVWMPFPQLSYEMIAPVLTAITPTSTLNSLCCKGVELGQTGYAHVLSLAQTVPSLKVINVNDAGLAIEQVNEIQRALQEKLAKQKNQLKSDIQTTNLNKKTIILHSRKFSFSTFWISPPLNEEYPPIEVPEDYCCPITHEIMFDPVLATDGFTYERETIQTYLKNKNTSPMTREPFESKTVFPNRNSRAMIRSFLDKNPQCWDEVYMSEKLFRELLQISSTWPINLERWERILQDDPRLLTAPLVQDVDQKIPALFAHLCSQDEKIAAVLLPRFAQRLKSSDWQKLMRAESVQNRLKQIVQACGASLDAAIVFFKALEKGLDIEISPVEVALYALEEKNFNLFYLALSQLPEINQVLDDEKNTLLHLAAKQGQTEMVRYLLDNGANLKQKNGLGLKAEALARNAGFVTTAKVITLEKITPALQDLGFFDALRRLELVEKKLASLPDVKQQKSDQIQLANMAYLDGLAAVDGGPSM